MKKTLVGLALIIFIMSCGNNNDSNKKTADNSQAVTAEPKKDPEAEKGLEMIAKSDCFTCHKNTEASTGPAYQDVAAKYPNDDNTIDSLSNKIITGGAGHWGQIPMTPHPTLSKEDAKAMLKYIMSLKK
ncbi:MAG: hypothetical protein JWN76_967 [Chitinophagaceae bacterium]|nr:hypothetical protein [Chitinophagaceae bacterium]